jgi:hypothetical protein
MTDTADPIRLPSVLALDDDTRIATRAATPDQLEQAARYLKQQAEREQAEAEETVAAMRELGAMARKRGLTFIAELGDLPAKS